MIIQSNCLNNQIAVPKFKVCVRGDIYLIMRQPHLLLLEYRLYLLHPRRLLYLSYASRHSSIESVLHGTH